MRHVERSIGALAAWSHRRPLLALGLVALASIASLAAARSLTLDADLTGLLPRSFASVRDLDRLKERFGGIGYVVVVAEGPDPAALRALADQLAPELERLPGVRYVEHRRSTQFFRDHALYYLEPAALEEIERRVRARERWEKRRLNPLYLQLEEEAAPPPLAFDDLSPARTLLRGSVAVRRAIISPGRDA
jgi:hypothetical protein